MKKLWLAAVMCVGFSGAAISQGAPPAISVPGDLVIAMRQSGMSLTGGVTDAMKAGIASGADVKVFEEGAEGLAKYSKIYGSLFPDGTQTGHGTKAKAEIWTDKADWDKALAAFVEASDKLYAAVKTGDKAQFAAAFADEGKTCGGCHRQFKAR